MNGIYREWSGYYAGIIVFMLIGYTIMQFPSTKLNIFIGSLFLLCSSAGCGLSLRFRLFQSDFAKNIAKAYGFSAFFVGLMCLSGAATK